MIITNPCQKVGEEWISAGTSLFGAKNFRISKMGTMFMNSWRMVILHELLKWLYNFLNYWWMDMQVHTILSSDHLGHYWFCLLALVSGALLLLGLLSGGVPSSLLLLPVYESYDAAYWDKDVRAVWPRGAGCRVYHRNTGVIQDYIEEYSTK
jgi:hypothetical protein